VQGPLTGSLLATGTMVAVNAHAYGLLSGGLLAWWLPVRTPPSVAAEHGQD